MSIYSWVCGLPLDYDQLTRGYTLKTTSSLINYQLPMAPHLGEPLLLPEQQWHRYNWLNNHGNDLNPTPQDNPYVAGTRPRT